MREVVAEGDEVAVRATETTERLRDAGYAGLDDRMLVLDFQAGQEDAAYDEIYRRYAGLARHVAFRILADRDAADEIVQETMLRVYQGLPRFNGRYLLQPWVARIATNVSLDVLRAGQRRPQLSDRSLTELIDEIGWDDDDLDEQIDRILRRDEVRAVLAELPEHHRAALVQREFDGRSHEEIAESLGMTPPQAKALIHRAKGSFRRAWEAERRSGVAAWLPWFLLPNLFRKLQGATETAATRIATSPVVQTVAPVASEQSVSAADKITAAIVVVALASTVGAVAVKEIRDRSAREPAPVVAPAPSDAADPRLLPTVVEPETKEKDGRRKDANGEDTKDPNAEADVPVAAAVPAVEEPSASPSPPTSPEPSEAPKPTVVPPPAWGMTFTTDAVAGAPCDCGPATLITSTIETSEDGTVTFVQVAKGPVVGAGGQTTWSAYVEAWGTTGPTGRMDVRFTLLTPEGNFRYEGLASPAEGSSNEDGSITYRFTGLFRLADEVAEDVLVPRQGSMVASFMLWEDGSLVSTTFSLSTV